MPFFKLLLLLFSFNYLDHFLSHLFYTVTVAVVVVVVVVAMFLLLSLFLLCRGSCNKISKSNEQFYPVSRSTEFSNSITLFKDKQINKDNKDNISNQYHTSLLNTIYITQYTDVSIQ